MSGEKTGVALAVQAAEDPELSEEEQLDMLGLSKSSPKVQELVESAKKRGRPKGARNLRTLAMANYLLSKYRSPLEGLAQMANTRVEVLAAALGCTQLEAWQEIRLARIALLPYMHQKMPVAVDVSTHKVVHLTIVEGEAGDAGIQDDDETLTLAATLIGVQEANEDG